MALLLQPTPGQERSRARVRVYWRGQAHCGARSHALAQHQMQRTNACDGALEHADASGQNYEPPQAGDDRQDRENCGASHGKTNNGIMDLQLLVDSRSIVPLSECLGQEEVQRAEARDGALQHDNANDEADPHRP